MKELIYTCLHLIGIYGGWFLNRYVTKRRRIQFVTNMIDCADQYEENRKEWLRIGKHVIGTRAEANTSRDSALRCLREAKKSDRKEYEKQIAAASSFTAELLEEV
jgi:hypothetical protein